MKEDRERLVPPGYGVAKPDILAEVERGEEPRCRPPRSPQEPAAPAGTSRGDWPARKMKSEEEAVEPGGCPAPGTPHRTVRSDFPGKQSCSYRSVAEPDPPGDGDGGFGQKPDLVRHRLARAAERSSVCGNCGFAEHGGLAARRPAGSPYRLGACASSSLGAPAEAGAPRKERKELSLTEKVRVLEMLDGPKVSQSELAKRFGVSQPQICRIIKNKERILSEWHQNSNPERKRKREGKDVAVEAALLRWVESARAADLPVNGPLLQVKAKNLAEALGKPDFDASSSWLARFKVRHNITFKKPPRDKKDAEQPTAEHWAGAVLPDLLRSYAPSEIYSCGETGVLFRAAPPGALPAEPAARGERAGPGDRLTLLLCTNADGSEKAALLAVGQSAGPRCLRGVNPARMPWTYRASGLARMTAPLFAEWLQEFNEEMQRKGKSVVLFLDKHEAHPYLELSNVRMVFVPPAAALAQPLDRGVIRDLKGHYRRRLLTRLPWRAGGGAGRAAGQPTLLDALHMLVQAWGDVRPALIASCFRAAGFGPEPGPAAPALGAVRAPGCLSQEQFERFALLDEGLDCFGEPADAEMTEVADWDGGTASSGEEAEEPAAARPCPSEPQVRESLATLRRYLECRATSPALFQAFYQLEDAVHAAAAGALPGDAWPKQ
ncbi:tigger transposable element-derived protein 3-like isoform X2 [Dromaius novaehollandiae]|uniref:tigger transposable element-derived protein 3-like isoform X2 n=1 Tax=Dromaius novaehollandiae TaxID=8790 RepID=UPI00311D8D1B